MRGELLQGDSRETRVRIRGRRMNESDLFNHISKHLQMWFKSDLQKKHCLCSFCQLPKKG